MKKEKRLILLVLSFLTVLSAQGQEWKLVKEAEDIQAYTRTIKGTSVKSYKAQALINTPIDTVFFLFTDLDSYKKIMKDMAELELIQNTNNVKYVLYSKMKMPWPVENRDMVTETIIKNGGNGRIVIKSTALKNRIEPKDGFVRIEKYWEVITLISVGKENVEIQIEGLFDMGGNLPSWIINMYLIDGPIDIIKNIRKQVE